ncbi:TANC1-like [Homarus americanus]|uniref:TANC1-like n=1 Tax=Homarus americanus TaxID=6706 RepID=A0A8J5JPU8_HOMAM|nr:TANC1-like [Homarus americanus]
MLSCDLLNTVSTAGPLVILSVLQECEGGMRASVALLLLVVMLVSGPHYVLCRKSPGMALLTAATKGKLGRMRQILQGRNADINYAEKSGWYRGYTALMWAASRNNTVMVEELLMRGADVNRESYAEYFPLYLATTQEDTQMVVVLLEAGAETNLQTSWGVTALQAAAVWGQQNVSEKLLQYGALPDLPNTHGRTALHWASRKGHIKAVAQLLESCPDLTSTDRSGKTALEVARLRTKAEMTRLLIDVCGSAASPSCLHTTPATSCLGDRRPLPTTSPSPTPMRGHPAMPHSSMPGVELTPMAKTPTVSPSLPPDTAKEPFLQVPTATQPQTSARTPVILPRKLLRTFHMTFPLTTPLPASPPVACSVAVIILPFHLNIVFCFSLLWKIC